jgi:CheY-like chemotaxis protein
MDRLFKSFSQVDASTTRQYGGSGLGLAICKRIVELMAGRIWVESTGPEGSVFCFEVTVAPVSASRAPIEQPSTLAGRRVLVVDESATSRRIVCQLLTRWGINAVAVASGREALALLGEQKAFDLALVDAVMPEMSGPELVAAIRRQRSAFQLPVAMLTLPGRSRMEDNLGIAGFVSKPIKEAALFDMCVEILQGRRATSTTELSEGSTLGLEHPLAILLAEDNPVNQRVAILMLQRIGFRADLAANGREALEAVTRQRYDLVLMDVQMPEMDGLQATREIRARFDDNTRPRIVAMTANASVSDRDECLAAGMDGFLTKPVRTADLRNAILATPVRYVASAA